MRAFPTIQLCELITPCEKAIAASLGTVDNTLLTQLIARDFHQAPVYDGDSAIGLVSTSHLTALMNAGMSLLANDPRIVRKMVQADDDLGSILIAIESHGFAGVNSANTMIGFFTLSDLNKHPVRAAIYPLFAELESELAIYANRHYENHWAWLEKLDKDKQARLIGYWELSKREGVNVGPVAGATLSELSKIIGLAEPLRERFGFTSKGKWDEFFGGLIELRNSVMHPVRPLLTSIEDVKDLHDKLSRVLLLLQRLKPANAIENRR